MNVMKEDVNMDPVLPTLEEETIRRRRRRVQADGDFTGLEDARGLADWLRENVR